MVSINIRITLCDNCAELHRELGTHISRIQRLTLEEQCRRDSLLVKLIKLIGNENGNKFWAKKLLTNSLVNINRKYKLKSYIDDRYCLLSSEELFNKLRMSVCTNDIVETARLWFSDKTNFCKSNLEELVKIAKQHQQVLQEKFLVLQDDVTSSSNKDILKFEGVFQLSYNNEAKFSHSFLINLFSNKIVILMYIEKICVIYLDSINIVSSNYTQDSLEIIIKPPCKFLLKDNVQFNEENADDIQRLYLYDDCNGIIEIFKKELFKYLLWSYDEISTDDISLFLLGDIRINQEEVFKCKCYLKGSKLILYNASKTEYDLNYASSVTKTDDVNVVLVKITDVIIEIRVAYQCDRIFEYLKGMSSASLSLNNIHSVNKLNELIKFIKIYGLRSKDIFRTFGDSVKVEELFSKVIALDEHLCINQSDYSVHDAVSCLKKCLRNLYNPLINDDIYTQLKYAAYTEDERERLRGYQSALKSLPSASLTVLTNIVEVLFIIIHLTQSDDGINSEKLAKLTWQWILTPQTSNKEDNTAIIKFFIDQFVNIFNYSEEDQQKMAIFISKFKVQSQRFILRSFYIDPHLKEFISAHILANSELRKVNFLEESNSFIFVNLDMNNVTVVDDLITRYFNNATGRRVNLWHFVGVNSKMFKRLLYGHCRTAETLLKYPNFPKKYLTGKSVNYFIILQNDVNFNCQCLGSVYKCDVKINNEKSELLLTLPNSLKIFKNNGASPCIDVKLCELFVYRAHEKGGSKIYILFSDDHIISCVFRTSQEFNTFLTYFDNFILSNVDVI